MTFLATPKQLTIDQAVALIHETKWDKGWTPSFVTGHNTAIPRLSQYLGWSEKVRRAQPAGLNTYYKHLGWHSGPHFEICPLVPGGGVWQLCDLEHDGVSVSCWNKKTIGIECVGDYETEDPTTGHGAEVRDQFIALTAAFCRRFGWKPRPQVLGQSGVHWHKQCTRDHHPCPGKRWDGDDVIHRIEEKLAS